MSIRLFSFCRGKETREREVRDGFGELSGKHVSLS